MTTTAMKRIETIDEKKALCFSTASNKDLEKLFKTARNGGSYSLDEEEGFKFLALAEQIRKSKNYVKKMARNNFKLEVEYQYKNEEGLGRRYSTEYSLQYLPHNVRNYLMGSQYYDIDIVNSQFSLMLSLVRREQLEAPMLEDYVRNRNAILSREQLTKEQMIMIINIDEPKDRRGRTWLNDFVREIKTIKNMIYLKNKQNFPSTQGSLNPISSVVSKTIFALEDMIIKTAEEIIGEEHMGCYMFDGFGLKKESFSNEELEEKLLELNEELKQTFGDCVKMISKPTDIEIEELDNLNVVAFQYENVKKRFEAKTFLLRNPLSYWREVVIDGKKSYKQLNLTLFKEYCKEFQILVENPKGGFKKESIFKTWSEDPTKRAYDQLDFLPYCMEDTTPSNIFNDFEPFTATTIKDFEPRCVKNFENLLLNLCGDDAKIWNYFRKWLAFKIRFPSVKMEQIFVFRGNTGTGKDTLQKILGRIVGGQYITSLDSLNKLFGDKNGVYLYRKLFCFMNEIGGTEGHKLIDSLKNLSTAEKISIDIKYQEQFDAKDFNSIFVFSNGDSPIKVEWNDRRIIIITSSIRLVVNRKNKEKSQQNREFWAGLYADMEDPNWIASVLKYLLDIDLSKFDPKKPPTTKETEVAKQKNIPIETRFISEMLENKELNGFITSKKNGKSYIPFKTLFQKYKNWVSNHAEFQDFKITQKDTRVKFQNLQGYTSQVKVNQPKAGIKGLFEEIDLEVMKEYLDEFVMKEPDSKPIDIGDDLIYEKDESGFISDEEGYNTL